MALKQELDLTIEVVVEEEEVVEELMELVELAELVALAEGYEFHMTMMAMSEMGAVPELESVSQLAPRPKLQLFSRSWHRSHPV